MTTKIFYLDSEKIDKVRKRPSIAWEMFEPTRLSLWEIPELETDKANLWEVEFIPCYTEQHFCVLVRIDATGLKSRDRAYQNGGGFVFQLAQPRENDELSDVFTVFGASPLETRENLQWSRFFVYYKDIDLVFTKAEDGIVKSETDEKYTYFLVMAPWSYADPIGPFLTEKVGFNIIVPQPIEAKYPTQYYCLIPGWKIMSEQELRDYVVYEMESPRPPAQGFEVEFMITSKHYSQGKPGLVRTAVNSSADTELEASLELGGELVLARSIAVKKGMNEIELPFETGSLTPGRTDILIALSSSEQKERFSSEILVLDEVRLTAAQKRVGRLKKHSTGDLKIVESISTIEWLLESVQKKLDSLKPHQSPWTVLDMIERLEDSLARVEAGESIIKKGVQLRLGLRSKQDETLQPYSMYIPPTFKEGESGLVVMLHGSGTNDERTLKRLGPLDKYDKTKMIVVAPLARGESHYYLPEEAIQEIIEITEKLVDMFSIPRQKIVLSGFSMGGFGALNTFFHRPDLYRNLILVSGAMKAYDEMKIIKDFTTPECLAELAKTNLAIFHGAEDLNVSYADLKPVHDRLMELNPELEIHVTEGVGHQQPPEWEERILKLLQEISKKEA